LSTAEKIFDFVSQSVFFVNWPLVAHALVVHALVAHALVIGLRKAFGHVDRLRLLGSGKWLFFLLDIFATAQHLPQNPNDEYDPINDQLYEIGSEQRL